MYGLIGYVNVLELGSTREHEDVTSQSITVFPIILYQLYQHYTFF